MAKKKNARNKTIAVRAKDVSEQKFVCQFLKVIGRVPGRKNILTKFDQWIANDGNVRKGIPIALVRECIDAIYEQKLQSTALKMKAKKISLSFYSYIKTKRLRGIIVQHMEKCSEHD